jgi:uncharacterized protein YkwD
LAIILSFFFLAVINPAVKVIIMPQDKKQSTGVYLKKGDKVKIKVSGKWSLWDKYDQVGGEGHQFVVDGFNWGALMGVIGDNSEPFIIGNAIDFTSQNEGVLYLYPNKGNYKIENPSGSLEVNIDGGIEIEKFKKQISGRAKKFLYDPKQGELLTNLYFKKGDIAEIYAFGEWSMWQDVYSNVTAGGHKFIANGVNWGKLYGGIGSTYGEFLEYFPIGEKAVYKVNSQGLLTMYPFLDDYESNPGGFLEIYIIGGRESTDKDKIDIDNLIRQNNELNIVAKINQIRSLCGLDGLQINPAFSKTSYDHAKYMVANNSFDRDEDETKPLFTGKTLQDRLKLQNFEGNSRELFCQTDNADKALDMIMDSTYHRLRLLDPRLKYIGYGFYKSGMNSINVFDLGYMNDSEQEKDWETIAYPVNEQTEVKVSWDGNESPDPLPNGTNKPLGYPVSILFKKEIKKIIKAEILDNNNKPVNCFMISPFTDLNNKQINGIILVPKKTLDFNTRYTVNIKIKYADEDKDYTWTFITKTGE